MQDLFNPKRNQPGEIAEHWVRAAPELATWALTYLANRTDAFGKYRPLSSRKNGQVACTKKQTLTGEVLTKHFAGVDVGDLVGLHTTSPGNMARWFAIDIDKHEGDDADPQINLKAALFWHAQLEQMGLSPLLIDSNGAGGFHLIVILAEPHSSETLYHFAQNFIAGFSNLGLSNSPESFPKQPRLANEKSLGNFLRLPGRHHTLPFFSKVWNGETFVEGRDAIQILLRAQGSKVIIPSHEIEKCADSGVRTETSATGPGRLAASTVKFLEGGAEPGHRNSELFRAAADLKGNGLLPEEILEQVKPAATAAGLDESEIQRTVSSAASVDRTPSVGGEIGLGSPLIPPYQQFPIDALPPILREFVREGAASVGCDHAYVAVPLLAAIASAIGNSRRLRAKADWSEPCVIWAALVGESGTLKSPALDLVIRLVQRRQETAFREHKRILAEREETDPTSTSTSARAVSNPQRYICSDITVEALALLMLENPRGMLLYRDELAGLFSSFDAYRRGRGGDAANFLTMFGARPLTIDRKLSGPRTVYVQYSGLSIVGGIQPGTLKQSLSREHFEDGLAARFIFTSPPEGVHKWTETCVSKAVQTEIERVFDRLYSLPFPGNENGERVPVQLEFDVEAKQRWRTFFDAHSMEESDTLDKDLRRAWAKLRGYALRIALVHELARWASEGEGAPEPSAVDQGSLEAAISLVGWLGHEARRTYAMLKESPTAYKDRQVLDYVRRKSSRISVRDLVRATIEGLQSVRQTVEFLDRLRQLGWGVWEIQNKQLDERKSSDVFRLLPNPTPDKE